MSCQSSSIIKKPKHITNVCKALQEIIIWLVGDLFQKWWKQRAWQWELLKGGKQGRLTLIQEQSYHLVCSSKFWWKQYMCFLKLKWPFMVCGLTLLMISAWICKLFFSFSSRFTSEGCQDFSCLVLTLCLYTMFSLRSLGPAGFIIRAGFEQHQAHLQRFSSNPNFPSPSLPPSQRSSAG